ncbi:eukaryotic aspartyl protease [Opisthorchis viverrini]|uniref:Eukaryotic aspartyl protease n=1 Tax=Opisthorchis viverrini TaxID=6198 RepID=A0A1S8WXR5_OPIVI|nr:eukaryotic aspartyl protease [Opisthorchis viverrini]
MDIALGTPRQTLSIEVDTSTGTTLIVAMQSQRRMQFTPFKFEDSGTKRLGLDDCTVPGTDELAGRQVIDVLTIGECAIPEFHVQTVERLRFRPYFLDVFSGKLGLAPTSDLVPETFVGALQRQFPNEPEFTFWFRPDEDGVFRNGIFSFGGIHDYRYEGPLIYRPLLSPDSWTIQATKILLGETVLCAQDCNILFKTAIPYFYGPQDKITEAQRLLQVESNRMHMGVHTLNCNIIYPLLSIHFGRHQVQWRMSDFWEKKLDRNQVICKLGMRASASGPGWTLGHRMMFKLFTVFDSRRSRIGIAKASRP